MAWTFAQTASKAALLPTGFLRATPLPQTRQKRVHNILAHVPSAKGGSPGVATPTQPGGLMLVAFLLKDGVLERGQLHLFGMSLVTFPRGRQGWQG